MGDVARMSLPDFLLGGIETIRDAWTLGLTGEILKPINTPDGRGGENVAYESCGLFQCRLDAMEAAAMPESLLDTSRRVFGLTLPSDAPRMGLAWVVEIESVRYLVERAHDWDRESILRRYYVSVPENEWINRPQPETVRDDDWE